MAQELQIVFDKRPSVLAYMARAFHRAVPLSLWNALQIRNHLLQHRPIGVDECLELETRVAGQRILEKGAEVDLHTAVRASGMFGKWISKIAGLQIEKPRQVRRAPTGAMGGLSGGIFLYAAPPLGGYMYSRSDDKDVGADNKHYACVVDKTDLRVIEYVLDTRKSP